MKNKTKDKAQARTQALKQAHKKSKNKIKQVSHHDLLFKQAFSDSRFARELLTLVFTKKELSVFNLKSLKPEKDTFQDLKADLVFSVLFKNHSHKQVKIAILLEHKSKYSYKVFEQLLKYQAVITSKSLEETGCAWPIIPIVFYHGKKPWKWAKNFQKGLMGEILEEIPIFLQKIWLNFQVKILDIHDKKVAQAIRSKAFKSRGFLSLLKRAWDLKADEKELKKLIRLFDNCKGKDLGLVIGNYVWKVVPNMTKELWQRIEQQAVKWGIFPKGGYMNIREYIKEEGRLEGRQKYLQEGMLAGMQKGKQEKERQVIANMLKNKLGIPVICKVTGLSEAEIKKFKNGSK